MWFLSFDSSLDHQFSGLFIFYIPQFRGLFDRIPAATTMRRVTIVAALMRCSSCCYIICPAISLYEYAAVTPYLSWTIAAVPPSAMCFKCNCSSLAYLGQPLLCDICCPGIDALPPTSLDPVKWFRPRNSPTGGPCSVKSLTTNWSQETQRL